MKYSFALAAATAVGLVAAQPHVGHAHLHKKRELHTVTDWTIVTVTDVVTIYGPSPTAEAPKQPQAPPAPPKAAVSSPAAPPAPVSSKAAAAPSPAPPAPAPVAPPAQSPQPKPVEQPSAPAPAPAPAASSPAAAPAPAPAPAGGSTGGGSGVGKHGTMVGASVPADCTKDAPCAGSNKMTVYDTGLGACGYTDVAPHNDDVVALKMDMFGSLSNSGPDSPTNPLCNKKIQITNAKTGKTAVGTIRDRCPGCQGSGGLDLSPALWAKLNDIPGDAVPVSWYFLE